MPLLRKKLTAIVVDVGQVVVAAFRKKFHLIDDHLGPVFDRRIDQPLRERRLRRQRTNNLVALWIDKLHAPILIEVQPAKFLMDGQPGRLALDQQNTGLPLPHRVHRPLDQPPGLADAFGP